MSVVTHWTVEGEFVLLDFLGQLVGYAADLFEAKEDEPLQEPDGCETATYEYRWRTWISHIDAPEMKEARKPD